MVECVCQTHPSLFAAHISTIPDDELIRPFRTSTPSLPPSTDLNLNTQQMQNNKRNSGNNDETHEKDVLTNGQHIHTIPDAPPSFPHDKKSSLVVSSGQSKIDAHRHWLLAMVLLLSYVTLSVTSSQLTNYVFVSKDIDFRAPYLFTLLKMAFRLILFPLYLTVTAGIKLAKGKPISVGKTIRRCESIFGPRGLSLRSVVVKILPAALTMIIHQLTYTYAIANLTTSVATSLFALAVAISYILSWLFLNSPLLLVKSVFVGVSLAGVALISYASFVPQHPTPEQEGQNATFGIVSVLISTLFLSLHQLSFKKAFPKGDLGQVSFALLGVFGCICLLFWPAPIITYAVGEENYDIHKMPYEINIPTWLMSAVSSTVYGYGLVLSSPYFMSMGELAVLAINSGVDASLRGVEITPYQIGGTVLVGVAFLVMILPDHVVSLKLRRKTVIMTNVDAEVEKKLERQASTATLAFIWSTVPDGMQISAPELEQDIVEERGFEVEMEGVYFIDDDEGERERL